MEVNTADYHTLLRVPGIGVRSAQRIGGARRTHALDFDDLRRIGVVLKRALYFITCSGRMMYRIPMNEDYILNNILDKNKQKPNGQGEVTYQQLSFDDVSFGMSG